MLATEMNPLYTVRTVNQEVRMTKHTPATPLPWRVGAVTPARFPAYPIIGDVIVADVSIRARGGSDVDATYIARAANAYPKLVEMLTKLCDEKPGHWARTREQGRALLHELGE
jgi:hypothetical protein